MELTQDRLKELLEYNPDTGEFKWKITKNNLNAKKNSKAGSFTNNYNIITIDYRHYRGSHIAFLYMDGYIPENNVMHINGKSYDDRWCNLKHTSSSCKSKNSKLYKNSTSGVKGVNYNRTVDKWLVRISDKRKNIYIGNFKNFDDAVRARWEAEKKHNFLNCQTTSTAYLYLKNKGLINE